MPKPNPMRLISMPDSAYDLIMESLQLDVVSNCIEPKQRRQLQLALQQIQEVPCPTTITIHVRGGVAYEPDRCPPWIRVHIIDHDNH